MDLKIEQHGSVVLIRPMTPAGEAWLEDHVLSEGWQWFGGALASEPRFVPEITDGAIAFGLEVA